MHIDPDHQQLFEEACRYEKGGDTYTAVKLFKRLTKLRPEWVPPYRRLAFVYKRRLEWKPAYHYFKRTVALQSQDQEAWWNLAICATALKKWRPARSIWSKFGWQDDNFVQKPLGLQLQHADSFEILWIMPLDPTRGQILSIPHPISGLRFRDIVLYDRPVVGHHVVNQRRIPVHSYLDTFKSSAFQTFSCLLHTAKTGAIRQLEKMCQHAGIGFEVWSNASRAYTPEHRRAFPEYYSQIVPQDPTDHCLVALAAVHEAEVQYLLDNWQIVTLENYSDLRAY